MEVLPEVDCGNGWPLLKQRVAGSSPAGALMEPRETPNIDTVREVLKEEDENVREESSRPGTSDEDSSNDEDGS